MSDPFELIFQNSAKLSLFPQNSRYYAMETRTLKRKDGSEVKYIVRRFIPKPELFATLTEHTVHQGERPDIVAATYLGDPEQFWRICDANGVMQPGELTEKTGGTIRIALPEGVPGEADD
jgi:hypothetical protein